MNKTGLWPVILISLLLWFGISKCFGQEEIPYDETRPAIIKIGVDTVKFLHYTKTAIVTLRYLDADGGIVKERDIIFIDKEDDPLTEIDETLTEYTQFLNGLGINNTFLKNAIKVKLGL